MREERLLLPQISDEKELTASDLQKAAGLSYRQLNSWDEKGILPESRQEAGWRKFTANEVFVLLICKELKDRFGISLEKLKTVREYLLQDNHNYLRETIGLTAAAGLTVCLVTDLKEIFIIDNDWEISNFIRGGLLRNEYAQDFIILRLNPLVNSVLKALELETLPTKEDMYDILAAMSFKRTAQNEPEYHLLELVRSKNYRSVTIHLNDGRIIQTDALEELGKNADDGKEILKIIKEKKFQSIIIDLNDGKVVRLTRKSPVKYNKVTGKP